MELTAQGIRVGYGRQPVLHGLDLALTPGSFTGIVGPNGCGKSTLLKVMSRLMRPWSGQVRLDGCDLAELGRRRLAQSLAVLPQHPDAPPQMTVRELVSCGRYPHVPRLGRVSPVDREAIARAMHDCELDPLADRPVAALSGGQRQRVWLATALAQEPAVLLLDEPLASLDINHQLDAMALLATLNQRLGMTVAVVLHDLNLAARFCDTLALMHQGQVVARGEPEAVFAGDAIGEVFQVDVHTQRDPVTRRPVARFYRRGDSRSV